jgi:hypothetical protein
MIRVKKIRMMPAINALCCAFRLKLIIDCLLLDDRRRDRLDDRFRDEDRVLLLFFLVIDQIFLGKRL